MEIEFKELGEFSHLNIHIYDDFKEIKQNIQ